jgi:hypothetical protein
MESQIQSNSTSYEIFGGQSFSEKVLLQVRSVFLATSDSTIVTHSFVTAYKVYSDREQSQPMTSSLVHHRVWELHFLTAATPAIKQSLCLIHSTLINTYFDCAITQNLCLCTIIFLNLKCNFLILWPAKFWVRQLGPNLYWLRIWECAAWREL